VEKISFPELKKMAVKEDKKDKKTEIKSKDKKKIKRSKKTIQPEKEKSVVKKTAAKENISSAEKKIGPDNKITKTGIGKKDKDKVSGTKKIELLKSGEKKKDGIKEQKKDEKDQTEVKFTKEDLTVKKMAGVVRIENDSEGRIFIYTTLKDSMDFQKISLNGRYSVTKINFRTRDDEYYQGNETDRSGITEIEFSNKGKKISFRGIEALKKSYTEKFNKTLIESIAGETFIMYENNEITLRMTFKKDGNMEFFDRYKCSRKGDADCTYKSMPDKWRVTDGKLYMRYHTLWRVWKYELDSQNDMLDEKAEQAEPPRWMKIFYKDEDGFSDRYLDLVRSDKEIWAK